MSFGAPIWFWALLAIPVLAVLFARAEQRGVTKLREFVSPRLLPQLAVNTFGKSAAGNRALIIFTDGEELNGDAAKTAKSAADAGVRIFTVGVGTPQGSLIPINSDDGGTAFVKDSAGQVVKSKLDEKRLHEIAQISGGFYLHLDDGPRTMSQLYSQGLANMKAADIDARLGGRAI